MIAPALTRRRAIAISLILLAAIGAAGWYWRAGRDSGPTYREAAVSRGDLELGILSTGVVQPQNRLEIKAPIPGRAEEVLVDGGSRVKKGQVLAWMSSTERAALIDAARAKGLDELKRWEDIYRATPILAPLNGSIISRNIEPGQTFTGTDAVFVMSDRLIVKAQVDETDIGQIKLHQRATLTLDAYPNQTLHGTVDQIAFDATTVNNVTTYVVEVVPDKVPAFMRSGMTANVNFIVARRHDVLIVPTEAIRTHDRLSEVLVRASSGDPAPVKHRVELGISDGRRTEVLSGIVEGDRVLIPGLSKTGTSAGSSPLSPFGSRRR